MKKKPQITQLKCSKCGKQANHLLHQLCGDCYTTLEGKFGPEAKREAWYEDYRLDQYGEFTEFVDEDRPY